MTYNVFGGTLNLAQFNSLLVYFFENRPIMFPGRRSQGMTKPGFYFYMFILCFNTFVFVMSGCLCCVTFSSLSTGQEIGWKEHLRVDRFCVE